MQAPMISVPAGVLKEFMTTNNSRTPTPPLSTVPVKDVNNVATTVTNNIIAENNKSRTPTPPSRSTPPTPSQAPTATPAHTPTPTHTQTPTPTPTPTQTPTPTPTLTPTPTPTSTPTQTLLSNSRTNSPLVPISFDSSSITITPSRKQPETLVNGKGIYDDKVQSDDSGHGDEKENGNNSDNIEAKESVSDDKKDKVKDKDFKDVSKTDENTIVNNKAKERVSDDNVKDDDTKDSKDVGNTDENSIMVNGTTATGLKRANEEDGGGANKPDLKKIRVFPRPNEGPKCDSSPVELSRMTEGDSGSGSASLTTVEKTTPVEKTSQNTLSEIPVLTPLSSRRDSTATTNASLPKERPILDRDLNVRRKVQRLTRKELESIVMRLFSEKLLYESEMGKMKQLREKLEATLENNRKKTAQFHKEIEDMRKVTNRLTSEHIARKGQYVTPIRIKRSVGIQAAPHIINKGIMHANGNGSTIKTISPSHTSTVPAVSSASLVGVLPTNSMGQQSLLPSTALGILTTGAGRAGIGGAGGIRPGQGQIMMMAPATTNVQTLSTHPANRIAHPGMAGNLMQQNRLVRAPMTAIGTVMNASGHLLGQRPILLQGDKSASLLHASKNSGIIDLTDEDDGRARAMAIPKPGTLVKVPGSGTTQLVPISQAGQVGQVVLLPNSGGQPTTALIVSQVSTAMQSLSHMSSPAVAQARIGGSSVVGVTGSIGGGNENRGVINTISRTTTSTMPQSNAARHPAPLPRTAIQQVAGLSKKLPPQPTLKLSHKESSIVLSWTMAKTEDHETIASYQLYAYQEGATPPSPSLWKKVGSVKALELPMACTLTQFMPGHVYHFAVRAVDIKSRLGPFSDPRSIKLDKK